MKEEHTHVVRNGEDSGDVALDVLVGPVVGSVQPDECLRALVLHLGLHSVHGDAVLVNLRDPLVDGRCLRGYEHGRCGDL